MSRSYLLTPGPVNVPEPIRAAMAEAMLHHRTKDFEAIIGQCRDGMRALFGTTEEVIPMACTGSGVMEAAVLNTCSPGDKVIAVRAGKFGERWSNIGKRHGLEVINVDVEWGDAVEPATIASLLKEHSDVKAVLMQANETSTAVTHPVQEIAALTRDTDTLLIVDGITAVGVFPVPMDAWGVDVLVTGSQKALMLPPGLGLIALSKKAWAANESAQLKTLYFDLKREAKKLADNTTGFTPAVTLLIGLNEVLKRFAEEGYDKLYARHAAAAKATRAGVEALGLSLFSKAASDALTAIEFTGEPGPGPVIKHLESAYGLRATGGQDHLKGRIMRISHMGDVDRFHVLRAIGGLESTLHDLGIRDCDGSGVAAVLRSYAQGEAR